MSLEIRTSKIERIDIECPMDERGLAVDYAFDNGYHMLRSGPKMVNEFRADPEVFHLQAEKIVS